MRTVVLAGLALAWPLALAAQGACTETEALKDCWHRLSTTAPAEGQAEEIATEQLHGKSTGIAALGSGFASAIGDFLPLLAGNLGLTQTTTEDGATAFELNLPLPVGASPQRVKFKALQRKPKLYQPLADTLSAATRDARAAALEKELRDFDDLTLSAAWNLESGSFGRSFARSRYLYAAYFQRAVNEVADASQTQPDRLKAILDFIAKFPVDGFVAADRESDPACADAATRPGNVPIDCFRANVRSQIAEAAAPAAVLTGKYEQELRAGLADLGLYEFVDLVNNQPQLSIEGAIDVRRDLVGPNQFSFAVRYETGFSNVNALRRFCRNQGLAAESPECLSGYLASPGVRSSIRRGDRFFVSVEYARRQDYRVSLPADGIALVLPGTWDFTGSAGYGRYVAVNRQGEEVGRLDLQAGYVHHHNDPDRQNRFVATGTYTQRLSGALSLAAGFSYASKPEFLGEVDKKVSANFGLRYKFIQE